MLVDMLFDMRSAACGLMLSFLGAYATLAQTRFSGAYIQPSAPNTIPEMRVRFARDRYELRNATMVDLIRTAWDVKAENVVGGPEWLDSDRFDVIATSPEIAQGETLRAMLRALLKERFELAVHNGERSETVFEITQRKPKLKAAAGDGASGCSLAPKTVEAPAVYSCRNITMTTFAKALSGLREASGYLLNYRVLDSTKLTGTWDFTLTWQTRYAPVVRPAHAGAADAAASLFDAFDEQLGLRLSLAKITSPAIVVDRARETPTPNRPGALAAARVRPEFEVADIKASEAPPPCGSVAIRPGGKVTIQMTLRQLILETQGETGSHRLEGGGKALDGPCFTVLAKGPFDAAAPAGWNGPVWNGLDVDTMRAMLRSLLEDRFALSAHTEERPVTGYALVAANPKLRVADASNRPGCREGPGADGKDPRFQNPAASRLLTCRNVTLAQFAKQLSWQGAPIMDGTGLRQRYDITINFTPPSALPPLPQPGERPEIAPEPAGVIPLDEALRSQLGLRLEPRRVLTPVLVIDRVNAMPTEN